MTFVFKVYRKDWKANMQAFYQRCVDFDAGICAEVLAKIWTGEARNRKAVRQGCGCGDRNLVFDCRFGKLTNGVDDFPNASKVEIEEKVTKLRKRLEEEGPYDIVLGFSQGTGLLRGLWRKGISPRARLHHDALPHWTPPEGRFADSLENESFL